MQPNFNKGERIYLQRFFTPKFGDMVLYESPRGNDDAYLGRVVALEGDTVEVHQGEIKINGIKIQFTWNVMRKDERILPMDFSMRDFFPLIKLKRNEYFVLSDNLDRAIDSRFFGPLQRKQIKGKYFYTIPFGK
jgi:signal peptidase I